MCTQASGSRGTTARQKFAGLLFGVAFGFILQKGQVGQYDVLMGALLLTDATVPLVMLAAIVTGMAGVQMLERFGRVALHPKPTRYGANLFGGLLFGAGFAVFGYCPGTAAAALGQGNLDALAGMIGMMFGSFLYALDSGGLAARLQTWGVRGKVLLPDQLGIRRERFVIGSVTVLLGLVLLLERVAPH